jgi:hypothetical protein
MDKFAVVLSFIGIVLTLLGGCMTVTPPLPNETTGITPATTAVITIPVDNQTCTTDDDCVPAQCCHPTSCMNQVSVHVCNFLCTASCEGPLDCGAGTCGCVNGRCSVVPAASSTILPRTSLRLTASPQRYSPLMSSTVGVGIDVNASGFDPAGAMVTWNATYGYFLSWGPVNYTVTERGNPVTNHGEKLYWSFIEKPTTTSEPVIIIVTATDPATGRVLGVSSLTLDWDGDYGVTVRNPL